MAPIDQKFTNSILTGVMLASAPGICKEAGVIQKANEQVARQYYSSVALNEKLDEALRDLEEVYDEAKEENWDGYDALAVSNETYRKAVHFLHHLADSVAGYPSASAMPNGDVAFDWFLEGRNSMTLLISESDKAVFAGSHEDSDFSEICHFSKVHKHAHKALMRIATS